MIIIAIWKVLFPLLLLCFVFIYHLLFNQTKLHVKNCCFYTFITLQILQDGWESSGILARRPSRVGDCMKEWAEISEIWVLMNWKLRAVSEVLNMEFFFQLNAVHCDISP